MKATKTNAGRRLSGSKQDEHGGLPDMTLLAIGMKVMVTFNIETDLDIANGMRGEIVKIVLRDDEPEFNSSEPIVELQYPPTYILVKPNNTRIKTLEGLEENIVPIVHCHRREREKDSTKDANATHASLRIHRLSLTRSNDQARHNRHRNAANWRTYSIQHLCRPVAPSRPRARTVATRLQRDYCRAIRVRKTKDCRN